MNEIEKKIYEAGQVQPVYKNSTDVLDAFDMQHKQKMQKKYFFIPAITTILSAAVATAVIFILKPNPVHIEGITNGVDDGSTVLTSLVCDLSIQNFVKPTSNTTSQSARIRALKSISSQDEFENVVEKIDGYYPSYSYYQSHSDGFNYSFDARQYKYNKTVYKYELVVNNTTLYLLDDLSKAKDENVYEGLIRLNDNCYQCEIASKVYENNYIQTEFTYRINTYYYTFFHSSLNGKTSIQNKVFTEDEPIETNSVEIEVGANSFTASFTKNEQKIDSVMKNTFVSSTNAKLISVSYKQGNKANPEAISYQNISLDTGGDKGIIRTYSYEGLEPVEK